MYREQARIRATLVDLVPSLEFGAAGLANWAPAEIVLVDDGSDDQTRETVEPWVTEHARGGLARIRLVRHPANRGKGAAVRTGLLAAEGRWRLIMDADNSCRVTEAPKLLDLGCRSGAGLVAGSRRVPGSLVHARRSRRVMGWGFQTALSLLGMRLLSDTQCGFKLYRADLAEWVGRVGREDGWSFDLEHLLLASRAGVGIDEVGVEWSHRDGGQLRSMRDGLVMLRRAAALKFRARAPVESFPRTIGVAVEPKRPQPAPEPRRALAGSVAR